MRGLTRSFLAFLLIIQVAVASASEPGREFSGEAVLNSREGRNRMLLTLVANRFTPVEELKRLAAVLEEGGQFALLSALKNRRDGQLRLGVTEMPIALVAAEPVDSVYRYLFLTPRRIRAEEEILGEESLDYPFGIAVFEVDGFGRGEGTLHVAAALRIDADGHIEVEDFDGEDGRLERIKQVR